jgi:hypothetical protein
LTIAQKQLIFKLEISLANMVYEGHIKWAKALSPIIEWLHKNEPVIAILEGEALGLDEKTLNSLRIIFDVKKFS